MRWDLKMTDKNQMNDTDLETLFEAARRAPPDVPEALMARVVADAQAVQPAAPFWTRLTEALGGLPGLGGLVTAGCVGIWLGVSPPAYVPDLAGQVLGFESALDDEFDGDLDAVSLTGFGWDIEEG